MSIHSTLRGVSSQNIERCWIFFPPFSTQAKQNKQQKNKQKPTTPLIQVTAAREGWVSSAKLTNCHPIWSISSISYHPYDQAIPLLDIYPDKTVTWKDPCNPVITAALVTITKTWKQPKSKQLKLTDAWIKMRYTYMQQNTVQWQRGGQVPCVMTYMQNPKYDIDKYIYETKTDLQIQRTGFWLPRGDGWGGRDWASGISRCKLLYIGRINIYTDQVLLYSTGNYI